MQRIIIRNFGPISDIDIEISDFQLFIGTQASGKSTIAKSIYFFRSLRDDLIRYVYDLIDKRTIAKPLGAYSSILRSKFMEIWGTTHHLNEIHLQFFYTDEIWIKVTLEKHNKFINPEFSKKFVDGFSAIVNEAKKFNEGISQKKLSYMSSKDLLSIESEKRTFITLIESLSNKLFNIDYDVIFIPAGRSLLSTLSEQLQNIQTKKMDLLMRDFLFRISNTRELFTKSIRDFILEKRLLHNIEVDKDMSELATTLITDILKGYYKYDKDGEKIYIDKNRYVKLNYSSSGQQESVWILHLVFNLLIENKKTYVVIEEPEAHLYPTAQKSIIELISLLFNNHNNKILITTHSPYILGALNNLIYAHNQGTKNQEEVNRRINKKLWLDHKNLGVYMLKQGKVNSIVDSELKLIQNEMIDEASRIINDDFDYLDSL